jgi:hypothetical protein
MQLGQRKIQSINNQTDANAIACNVAWNESFGAVAREAPWNCLKANASLSPVVVSTNVTNQQTDIPSTSTIWTPGTAYQVNVYVTYASYLYQCLIANVASTNFAADLTKGYWFQTNYFSPTYLGMAGGGYGTEWSNMFQLPSDFITLIELNNNNLWGGGATAWGTAGSQGASHEIFQNVLYTNQSYAVIKYVQYQPDTTKYDSLFTDALVLKLASTMATDLRKDDATLSLRLKQEYKQVLSEARTKNAGEDKLRRYNIVSESRFIRSRWRSTNG